MFPNKNLAAVRNNSFFKDIDSANFKLNLNIKYFVEAGEGEIIYHSGDPTEYLYLIIEGEVKLKIPGASITSSLLLKKVKDNYFGEKEILENSIRQSYALANKNSLLYKIRKNDLTSVTWLNKKLTNNPVNKLNEEAELGKNKRESVYNGLIDNLPGQSFFNPEIIYPDESKKLNEPLPELKSAEDDIKDSINETLATEELNTDSLNDFEPKLLPEEELISGVSDFEENTNVYIKPNSEEVIINETGNEEIDNLTNLNSEAEVENEIDSDAFDEDEHEKLDKINFFIVNKNKNISKYPVKDKVEINDDDLSDEDIHDLNTTRLKTLNKLANFLIHDIDNPIQSIKQYSEHIKKQNINKDVNGILDMIIEQSNCIADLVQATLKYSEEKTISHPEPVPLNNVLNHILVILAEYVESRDVKLFKKFEGDGLVNIDRNMFYQACFQIAKNACDAMPNGGNIYITDKREGNNIKIEIKDNGFGIPDSIKDKIFEPFMTHGKKNKTGLGLTIAEKIILEHNGTIRAESDLGEGTTIIIVLPVLD
jgi:signal transduction histidine kinase